MTLRMLLIAVTLTALCTAQIPFASAAAPYSCPASKPPCRCCVPRSYGPVGCPPPCPHCKCCHHGACSHAFSCRGMAEKLAYERSQLYSWHSNYYDPAYGAPVALVVPPTAGRQTDYHWGVAGYRTTPIYHQFRRGFPGYSAVGGSGYFLPTPRWPSDTNQFGVSYVRGPW